MATAAAAARSRRTRSTTVRASRAAHPISPARRPLVDPSCGAARPATMTRVIISTKSVKASSLARWKVMSFHGTEEIHCTRMGRAGPGRHAQSARRGESDGQSSQRHRPVYTARTNRRLLAGSEQQGAQPLLPSVYPDRPQNRLSIPHLAAAVFS